MLGHSLEDYLKEIGVVELTKTVAPDFVRPKEKRVDKFIDPRDPTTGEVPF